MIRYQLVCDNDHSFDAWFRDSAGYEQQVLQGEVSCPLCGTLHVRKALMAPNLGRRKGQDEASRPPVEASAEAAAPAPAAPPAKLNGHAAMNITGRQAEVAVRIREALTELRRQVESSCDYVGDRFAEEARKIHYGETDARAIYGETSPDDAKELKDEGIDFLSVPWPKADG